MKWKILLQVGSLLSRSNLEQRIIPLYIFCIDNIPLRVKEFQIVSLL